MPAVAIQFLINIVRSLVTAKEWIATAGVKQKRQPRNDERALDCRVCYCEVGAVVSCRLRQLLRSLLAMTVVGYTSLKYKSSQLGFILAIKANLLFLEPDFICFSLVIALYSGCHCFLRRHRDCHATSLRLWLAMTIFYYSA